MKSVACLLLMASFVFAQAQSKPATAPSKSATAKSSASTSAKTGTAAKAPASAKPQGEMPLVHGVIKPLFTERVEDITIGAGKLAEPQKLYHVKYWGYLAATGQKFDSSDDHRPPLIKDGKPVMGADGKPELGEAQPLIFPQGMGRLIPGFDEGFEGMHVGGKRRIFIPWQLAYGTRDIPARDGHVGIPPKSNLIFDVELVDVTDMPAAPMPPSAARPAAPPTGSQPAAPPKPATPPPASTSSPSSAPTETK